MISAILGKKIDQSQSFTAEGKRIPVTRILATPCLVVAAKTAAKDGYNAIQFGFGTRRVATITKPELGHLKKAGLDKNPPRFLREIHLSDLSNPSTSLRTGLGDLKPGAEVKVGDIFTAGDTIQVTGISKGKGFQGVVKRHHFKGGPRTHGQSDRERSPGSIGQTTTPGRVYKGKRMAGRMGSDTVTVKNLKVVSIDVEKNILTVSGLVPGGRNALLVIEKKIN
ncbi:50S ribosomal protein L3 [Candidatus Gottesmanbacteria bacterium]|nr:50S ribosomal protein L3 [Candidatus Gottesmanbacteria bacterium]